MWRWLSRRSHPLSSGSARDIETLVSGAVERAVAVQLAAASRRGERQFIAGVALGIFGNAAIFVVAELAGPGVVAPLIVALIGLAAVAYADTALRGQHGFLAVYETIVLACIAVSLLLSLTVLLNLAGYSCAACQPMGFTLAASIEYLGTAIAVILLTRLVRRLLG